MQIAFRLETASLNRVLRGLQISEAQHVSMRLVKRTLEDGSSCPFLNFRCLGKDIDLVQDLPLVGNPLQVFRPPDDSLAIPSSFCSLKGERSFNLCRAMRVQRSEVSELERLISTRSAVPYWLQAISSFPDPFFFFFFIVF